MVHPLISRALYCIQAFACKVDFLRMALVYREGCFYSDWKKVCLQQNFAANYLQIELHLLKAGIELLKHYNPMTLSDSSTTFPHLVLALNFLLFLSNRASKFFMR